MTGGDLDDFAACCQAVDLTKRVESERFKKYTYDDVRVSDKVNLDITSLGDVSETDTASLPDLDVLTVGGATELNREIRKALWSKASDWWRLRDSNVGSRFPREAQTPGLKWRMTSLRRHRSRKNSSISQQIER